MVDNKHGGKREGAGRKPASEEKIKTYYTIKKSTQEAIKVLAKSPRSHGEVIDKAIEELLNKS